MQVIISFLELQSDRTPDEQTRVSLLESQNRIFAMAAVHDVLHQSESMTSIDLSEYLENICDVVFDTYNLKDDNITELKLEQSILDVAQFDGKLYILISNQIWVVNVS